MQKDNDSGGPSMHGGLTGRLRRRRGSNEVSYLFRGDFMHHTPKLYMLFSNTKEWSNGIFFAKTCLHPFEEFEEHITKESNACLI